MTILLTIDRKVMNYKECILSELCKNLQDYTNHLCERCIQTKAKDMCLDEEKRDVMQQDEKDVAMHALKT
jgi:hypothetical protein